MSSFHKKKVAVIIDWDNLRKGLFEKATKKSPSWKVNYMIPENLFKLVKSFIWPEEEIYRIFLYLTRPFFPTKKLKKKLPQEKISQCFKVAKTQKRFIETIGVCNLIALRKGSLKFRGLDDQKDPIFVQKQVDMLMGLDIAHLSYKKLVERIIFFCADTDIIPALKVARINGLQVILAYCPDIQQNINSALKFHSDFIRAKNFSEIFNLPCSTTQ
jgi:uncharacterized LabA/DUF88 family protein